MPHVYREVDKLLEQPRVGSGTCIDIVKLLVPGLIGRSTATWREGINVMEAYKAGRPIPRGTAIATFENGRYPQRCQSGYHGSCHHAGLLLAVQAGGIWIADQWTAPERPTIKARFIRLPPPRRVKLADGAWRDAGNNPYAYAVIE